MSQKQRFSAQPKTIQRDLRRVINAMGATSLKISQDIFEGTAEIVFDRSGQRYVFRCRKYEDALDNLRAAQLTTPAPVTAGTGVTYLWRALEEYGVTSEAHTLDQVFSQFFLGFAATPDDTVLLLGSGSEAWWQVLGVEPGGHRLGDLGPNGGNGQHRLYTVNAEEVFADPEEFQRLRRAYEAAVTTIERSPASS